jgi:microcystin-dependent protein
MRELIANLPGGRPFRNDDLLMLQAQHTDMWALALADYVATIGGQPHGFVLSGCQLTGAGPTYNLSAGLVYLGGRLCQVAAATNVSTNWFLVMQADDTVDLRSYRDSLHKPCAADYTAVVSATVNAGQPRIALNAIRRLADLQTFRPGIVTMWSGNPATLPHGVQLCDGTNGTPNLRGRFIVGFDAGDADYNAVGKLGGAKQVTLTAAQMPSHSHGVNDPGHSHTYFRSPTSGLNVGSGPNRQLNNESNESTSVASTGITIASAGGGQAHENRPPYYTLAFVTRVV